MKRIIVGLGNPGKEYALTRHNIGFYVLDKLFPNCIWKYSSKLDADIFEDSGDLYLKPQTFMNNSGKSVSNAMSFYKVDTKNLVVVHDDADIAAGTFKLQFERNAAGHHGVESIITALGTNAFWRVRIGLTRPENNNIRLHDWVLKKMDDSELDLISNLTADIKAQIDRI